MKQKKIYIVRHGETDNNFNHLLKGKRVNLKLNNTGLLQSQYFYEYYKKIPFRKIYTSKLIRSQQSVEQFISDGIPLETMEELNEIDYGIYDGKSSTLDLEGPYHQLIQQWEMGKFDAKIKDGESPHEVKERVEKFLNYLSKKDEEDLILICLHGRIMRILLCSLLGEDLQSMNVFKHNNMCLYVLLKREGMSCIEKFNDRSHLQKMPYNII